MSGNFGLGWLFSGKKKAPRANTRRRDFRHLRVETLEAKLPLAGNIAAFQAGTLLTLTGDAANNGMLIMGTNGLVRVMGQGSTINGQLFAQFFGVTDINIFDNGGSDVVSAVNLSLAGGLFASLDSGGFGNDVAALTNVNVGGDITIFGDPVDLIAGTVNSSVGSDVVTLTNVTAGDDVDVVLGNIGAVNPGAGRDSIVATRVTTGNNNPLDSFSLLKTGNGPDAITAFGLSINSDLFLDASPDGGNSNANDVMSITSSNLAGFLDIRTDDFFNPTTRGNDVVTVNTVNASFLTVTTQAGNDVVSVINSLFLGNPLGANALDSTINTSGFGASDRDTVTITGTTFTGGLNLFTGADTDIVSITRSVFAGAIPHTQIDLGDGNDVLTFNSNTVDAVAGVNFFGGNGFDIVYAFFNTDLFGTRVVFPQVAGIEVLLSF
jgi:hypothetical protein